MALEGWISHEEFFNADNLQRIFPARCCLLGTFRLKEQKGEENVCTSSRRILLSSCSRMHHLEYRAPGSCARRSFTLRICPLMR